MNMSVFYESLRVMGFGMVGIFVVISIFYATIVLLGKAFPEKANKG
ncbi:MAG: OadG-related small transporter subunit [Pseudomonadota bacterium]